MRDAATKNLEFPDQFRQLPDSPKPNQEFSTTLLFHNFFSFYFACAQVLVNTMSAAGDIITDAINQRKKHFEAQWTREAGSSEEVISKMIIQESELVNKSLRLEREHAKLKVAKEKQEMVVLFHQEQLSEITCNYENNKKELDIVKKELDYLQSKRRFYKLEADDRLLRMKKMLEEEINDLEADRRRRSKSQSDSQSDSFCATTNTSISSPTSNTSPSQTTSPTSNIPTLQNASTPPVRLVFRDLIDSLVGVTQQKLHDAFQKVNIAEMHSDNESDPEFDSSIKTRDDITTSSESCSCSSDDSVKRRRPDETTPEELFVIEKELKRRWRKHRGRRIQETLVKWKGYSDDHNSWVPTDSIQSLSN